MPATHEHLSYLKEKKIAECINDAVQVLLEKQPDSPYATLAAAIASNEKPSWPSSAVIDKPRDVRSSDLGMISLHQFQQPLNCCNITALAYAFSAIGVKTTVNDIFHGAQMPVAYVVNDGMTLGETFDVATRYAKNKKLPVSLGCYHMDGNLAVFDDWWKSVVRSVNEDQDDVLVFNFGVKIAHGRTKGGGHFSLVAAVNEQRQEITMADVHPMKYGAFWVCTAQQMFAAMVDKDSSSNRARGMICISKNVNQQKLENLETLAKAVRYPFRDLGPRWPASRLENRLWGFYENTLSTDSLAKNMGGPACLALALNGLGANTSVDKLMLQHTFNYEDLLNALVTPDMMVEMATKVPGFSAKKVAVNSSNFLNVLDNETNENQVVVLLFDINVALETEVVKVDRTTEAGKLLHGEAHWAAVGAVEPSINTLILCDTQPITTTQWWRCNSQAMLNALAALSTSEVVVISKGNSY
eukprot:TRINITY_DN16901_c0_g1_i1.p1 TRINITY_DN16901_c0_g1~~TRINITY_DN16901_c0_g1_i1.p1  ORF type:complete len:485 (+),score=35.79 TRINITY_DN16901_c0_g1_i1:46-1455(+)